VTFSGLVSSQLLSLSVSCCYSCVLVVQYDYDDVTGGDDVTGDGRCGLEWRRVALRSVPQSRCSSDVNTPPGQCPYLTLP